MSSDELAAVSAVLDRSISRVKDDKIKTALLQKQKSLKRGFKSVALYQKSINRVLDGFVKAARDSDSSEIKRRAAAAERCQNLYSTEMKALILPRKKRKEKATRKRRSRASQVSAKESDASESKSAKSDSEKSKDVQVIEGDDHFWYVPAWNNKQEPFAPIEVDNLKIDGKRKRLRVEGDEHLYSILGLRLEEDKYRGKIWHQFRKVAIALDIKSAMDGVRKIAKKKGIKIKISQVERIEFKIRIRGSGFPSTALTFNQEERD